MPSNLPTRISRSSPYAKFSRFVCLASGSKCGSLVLHNLNVVLLLPLLHLLLLSLILLDKVFQHLSKTLGVRLENWLDVCDCALDEDTVDHAEAFAVGWEGLESIEDEPEKGVSFLYPWT